MWGYLTASPSCQTSLFASFLYGHMQCSTRVGARSGLGPIWAHMGPYVFLKSDTFRVQTAPFDKIRTEFRRSRRRLYIPDLLKAKKMRRQIIIFYGGSVFFKSDTFRVQTAPFDKITIDFCRSRRRLHDSDFILTKNSNIWSKIPKIPQQFWKIPKNQWISMDFHGFPLWSHCGATVELSPCLKLQSVFWFETMKPVWSMPPMLWCSSASAANLTWMYFDQNYLSINSIELWKSIDFLIFFWIFEVFSGFLVKYQGFSSK